MKRYVYRQNRSHWRIQVRGPADTPVLDHFWHARDQGRSAAQTTVYIASGDFRPYENSGLTNVGSTKLVFMRSSDRQK